MPSTRSRGDAESSRGLRLVSQNAQPQASRKGTPALHLAGPEDVADAGGTTEAATSSSPARQRSAAASGSSRERSPRAPSVDRSPSAAAERKAARVARRAEEQTADIDADPRNAARELCLSELQRGPRTRSELALLLSRAGVPTDAADEVLGRFAEVGVVDDALFAQMWVDSRQVRRGLSRGALRQELRRKGVQDDVVTEALAGIETTDEESNARSLLERKLASTRGLDPQARARRLVGVLARKGFDAGLSYRVVREAIEQEGDDPDVIPHPEG